MSDEMMRMIISLQADTAQLKSGLAQAEAAIKGVDDNVKVADGGMKKMIGTLKNVAATIGVAFAGTQVANFAKESIMAASNMNEALSKVGVVFGENAAEVKKWASTSTSNFGMSERAALTAVGTFGNLFDAFGLGSEDTKKFSTSLTELAVDMASFNDMSVDDALQALRSGLSGETEPMKKFGSVLSETRLKTEALTLGLIKNTTDALDPAAKAQAAYSLIMKDTAKQQGDYDRTSSGTANTMRRVSAEMDNAKVAIGQGLLPIFDGLLKILEKGVLPVLKQFGKFLKNNQDEVKAFGIVLSAAAIGWGLYTAAQKLATLSMKNFTAAVKANPFGAIAVAIALVVAGLVKAYKNVDWFREAVNKFAAFALRAFAAIIPIIGKVYEAIAKIVTGPMRLFLTALSKLPGVGKYAKAGLDIINSGLDKISDFADAASKKANELADSLGKVNKESGKTKGEGKGKNKGGGAGEDEGEGEGLTGKAKEKMDKYKSQVKDLYKDINSTIKEAQEKRAEIEKDYNERVAEIREDNAEKIIDLTKDYNKRLENIEKDYSKRKIKIAEAYEEKKADIEKRYLEKKADLLKSYQDKVKDLEKKAAEDRLKLTEQAEDKRRAIIEQSINRLRSAWEKGATFSITDLFKDDKGTIAKTAAGLLSSLKDQLARIQALQKGAGELAGLGYSQTFIEQVVGAGPEIGLKMIDELKKATPEQAKEIQKTFGILETVQDSGLDDLAKSMNAGANLATAELRRAYAQVAIDLAKSLTDVDTLLKEALKDAYLAYQAAVDEADNDRKDALENAFEEYKKALKDAQAEYEEAKKEATDAFNEALLEANAALEKALEKAQKDFEKKIEAVDDAMSKKIASLREKLREVAALMNALQAGAGAGVVGGAPINPISMMTTAEKKVAAQAAAERVVGDTNITINGVNLSDPEGNAQAMMSIIKYGQTVRIASTTATGIQTTGINAARAGFVRVAE